MPSITWVTSKLLSRDVPLDSSGFQGALTCVLNLCSRYLKCAHTFFSACVFSSLHLLVRSSIRELSLRSRYFCRNGVHSLCGEAEHLDTAFNNTRFLGKGHRKSRHAEGDVFPLCFLYLIYHCVELVGLTEH